MRKIENTVIFYYVPFNSLIKQLILFARLINIPLIAIIRGKQVIYLFRSLSVIHRS